MIVAAAAGGSGLPGQVTAENFERRVLGAPGRIVLACTAPWCPACRRLAPVVEKVADDLQGRVAFYRLDTDTDPELAARYQIRAVPALLRFRDGEQRGALVGFRPQSEVLAFALGG